MGDHVFLEQDGEAMILRIDRPPVNAIDLPLVRAIATAIEYVASLPSHHPLIVTGSRRCFSAGLDLMVVPRYAPHEQRELLTTINRVIAMLYGAPRPVVAAINGHALAAGLVLALTCDYRVAASGDSRFGLPEVTAGVPYPAAPLQIIRAELPAHTARMLVLSGRTLDPTQALVSGLVDEVVAPDEVLPRALAMAQTLGAARAYGRIKAQWRADVNAAIAHITSENAEPMLERWV